MAAKVKECKQQYDDEVEAMKGKTHWDAKRKRHVPDTRKVSGIFQRRALILFQHKSDEKWWQSLKCFYKMAKRCYNKAEERKLDNIVENPKKQFCCRRSLQNESSRAWRCFVRMVCKCTIHQMQGSYVFLRPGWRPDRKNFVFP